MGQRTIAMNSILLKLMFKIKSSHRNLFLHSVGGLVIADYVFAFEYVLCSL